MAVKDEHKRVFVGCVFVGYLCLLGFLDAFPFLKFYSKEVPVHASRLHASLPRRNLKTPWSDTDIVGNAIAAARGFADISREVAERFELPSLKSASIHLDGLLADVNEQSGWKPSKRGLLGDLLGGDSGSSSGSDGLLSSLGSLLSGGQSRSSNSSGGGLLDGILDNGIGSLFSGLTGGLDNVAVSLGVGLGAGTAQGLNLSTPSQVSAMASSAAVMNGANPTGINNLATKFGTGLTAAVIPLAVKALPLAGGTGLGQVAFTLAQGIGNGTSSGLRLTNNTFAPQNGSDLSTLAGNLGLGISEPIARSVSLSQLLTSVMPSNQQNLGLMAFSLAQGIGNGTSSGLRLTNRDFQPLAGSDLSTLAGNIGLGISEPIAGNVNLSSLFSSFMSTNSFNLGQTVFSLAQGIGNGTLSALGLSKKAFAPSTGSDVASLAGNVGLGVSEPIVGSVNLSNILKSAVSGNGQQPLMAHLPSLLGGAGKGLGEGAAQGLGILKSTASSSSPDTLAGASNGTLDVPGVSELFTRSLSSSFLGSTNLSAVTAGAGNIQDSLVAQLPGVASALGTGLGHGSAQGLGLVKTSTAIVARDTSSIDIPLVVQDFAQSLSSSFLSTANLSEVTQQIGVQNPLGNINLNQILEPAALGLGSGLGKGAAIGLGLQEATRTTNSTDGSLSSGLDIEAITSDFAQGLSQSFLANGTLNRLVSESGSLLGSASLPSINLGQVGEGLARGLVGGAADAVDGAGGLQNIIDGKAAVDVVSNSSFGQSATSFNDSVGGAAAGFGRGLGGEGVALVLALLQNGTTGLNQLGAATSSASPVSTSPTKRDTAASLEITRLERRNMAEGYLAHAVKRAPVKRAQTDGIFSSINVTLIDSLLQKSSDALTCEGVGGLFGILEGLMGSKTLPQTTSGSGDILNSSALGLPTSPVTIQNAGNEFNIDLQNISLSVNGLSVVKFAVITALHAVFAIAAYFFVLPSILSLRLIEEVAELVGKPLKTDKSRCWSRGLEYFAYLPLAVTGVILGIVGMGSSGHFRTAHGIVGLITLILTAIAIMLSSAVALSRSSEKTTASSSSTGKTRLPAISAITTRTVLAISVVAVLSGFDDLRTFSLCLLQNIPLPILVGIGVGIVGALNGFATLFGIKWWLQRRMQSRTTRDHKEKKGEESSLRKIGVISRPVPVEQSRFSEG